MVVCLTASLVLAFSYELTKGKIEQQRLNEINRSLKAIFPDADSYEKKEVGEVIYYEAIKDGKLKGYVLDVGAGAGPDSLAGVAL